MNHPRIAVSEPRTHRLGSPKSKAFMLPVTNGERIRKIFLTSDIDHRHFYLEAALSCGESADQLNQRHLRGAMKTGCRAILSV